MKKFTSIIITLALPMILNAQSETMSLRTGEWTSATFSGDELKGSQSGTAYAFCDKDRDCFQMWDIYGDMFQMTAPAGHIFNYEDRGFGIQYVYGIVGFYSSEGNLLEKGDLIASCPQGEENIAVSARATKKMKKINAKVIDYIKKEKGSVRIVFPLYGGGEYDLTVPCFE